MKPPIRLYPRTSARPAHFRARLRAPRRYLLALALACLLLLAAPAPPYLPNAERSAALLPTAGLLLNTPTATVPPTPTVPPPPSATPTSAATATAEPTATATAEPSPLPTPEPVPTLMPTLAPVPPQPAAAPAGVRFVPILMYHYVRQVDRSADPLGYTLSVTPDQFAAQLDWLAREGYVTMRMEAVAQCLSSAAGCPSRAIALTFDDGYADALTAALPLLQRYGFVATFYVVNNFVGQPGYMNWDELRALRDAGMEIGAHSMTHSDLTLMNPDAAFMEIAESGQALAAQLQVPIVSFCYPAGRFNTALAEQVRAAGYSNATTTVQGVDGSAPFTLPRIRIYGDMSQSGFEWAVRAYGS